MASAHDRALNNAAYHRLKDELEKQYPHKQFVAFGRGAVLADSADFDELLARVEQLGWKPRDVMVVRVGDEPPDYAMILSPLWATRS